MPLAFNVGVWPRGSQILFASCRHAVPSAVGVFECESVVRRASIAVLVSRGLVPSYPRRSALITHTTTTGRGYRDAGPFPRHHALYCLFLALRPRPLLSMGWVPAARGRDDVCLLFVFGAVRLPTPMAAEVRVRVGVRAPKRPSAAFLLRAGAKLAENDGKNV